MKRKGNTEEFNCALWRPHPWQVVNLFVDTERRRHSRRKLEKHSAPVAALVNLIQLSNRTLLGVLLYYFCLNFLLSSIVCSTIGELFWIKNILLWIYSFSFGPLMFLFFTSVFIILGNQCRVFIDLCIYLLSSWNVALEILHADSEKNFKEYQL